MRRRSFKQLLQVGGRWNILILSLSSSEINVYCSKDFFYALVYLRILEDLLANKRNSLILKKIVKRPLTDWVLNKRQGDTVTFLLRQRLFRHRFRQFPFSSPHTSTDRKRGIVLRLWLFGDPFYQDTYGRKVIASFRFMRTWINIVILYCIRELLHELTL